MDQLPTLPDHFHGIEGTTPALHRAARAVVAYVNRTGLNAVPEGSIILCISDVTEDGAPSGMTPESVKRGLEPASLLRALPFGTVERSHRGDFQIGLVSSADLLAHMHAIGDDGPTMHYLERFTRHATPHSATVLLVDELHGIAAVALALPGRSVGTALTPMFWGRWPEVRLLQPIAKA